MHFLSYFIKHETGVKYILIITYAFEHLSSAHLPPKIPTRAFHSRDNKVRLTLEDREAVLSNLHAGLL